MKEGFVAKAGKWLMKRGAMRICIVDDEAVYFTPTMLTLAGAAGFPNIERYNNINADLFNDFHTNPRDIIILDVKGIVDTSIAKDGLAVAQSLYRNTSSFVAITSAHQFYLRDINTDFDYIIDDRLLTAVDFINELRLMVEKTLQSRTRFYQKGIFKVGFFLTKKAVLAT